MLPAVRIDGEFYWDGGMPADDPQALANHLHYDGRERGVPADSLGPFNIHR